MYRIIKTGQEDSLDDDGGGGVDCDDGDSGGDFVVAITTYCWRLAGRYYSVNSDCPGSTDPRLLLATLAMSSRCPAPRPLAIAAMHLQREKRNAID